MAESHDIHGTRVLVGSKVRVLKIKQSILERLTDDEAERVKSMEGEVFGVYEIDEWGGAWVMKWWHPTKNTARSHSLGLRPEEMEVIPSDSAD